MTDASTYEELAQSDIPQLPKADAPELTDTTTPYVLFGVREGLKPLYHEAFYSNQSSRTYISDTEIFTQLGRLYRQAWQTTGKIILDPNSENDFPLRHVAIHSFADNGNFLFLCPPYEPSSEEQLSLEEASARFTSSLQRGLIARSSSLHNSIFAQHLDDLFQAAAEGFDQV